MNILDAFSKFKKIRRPYTNGCLILDEESGNIMRNWDRNIYTSYTIGVEELLADDWEEYIEEPKVKNRKVVDIYCASANSKSFITEIKDFKLSQGFEILCFCENDDCNYKFTLKMVKYED